MSFYSQVNAFASEISPLVYVLAPPFDQQLVDQLDALHDALADDSAVFGPWGAQSCIDWQEGQAQGELGANINYWTLCGNWEDLVAHQLRELQSFLTRHGLAAEAEHAGWLVEQSATASEQAADVVPDAGDVWADTPDWIRWGTIAALGVLLLRATR